MSDYKTLTEESRHADGHRLSVALNDIYTERNRQMEIEGWLPAHDDKHDCRELARAAAAYALQGSAVGQGWVLEMAHKIWPWSAEWWKPTTKRRDLVKAGALIVAEIERLDRAAAKSSTPNNSN